MNLRQMIKRDGWRAVRSNWTAAVFVVFFFLVIDMVFFSLILLGESLTEPNLDYGFIQRLMRLLNSGNFWAYLVFSLFIVFLRMFMLSPMLLSRCKWYYNITEGKMSHVHILFRNYKTNATFVRAAKLYMIYLGLRVLLFVVCLLPATVAVIFGFSTFLTAETNTASGLGIGIFLLGLVLFLLAVIFFIYFCAKLFLVPYLYAQNPKLPLGQYLKRSTIYMKGKEGDLINCIVSFIPALISCIFVFPIFVVLPHLYATLAIYGRFYIEQNEMQKPTVYRSMYRYTE